MSDIEKFYEALRSKFPESREWYELSVQEQHTVVAIVNSMLQILCLSKKTQNQ